MQNVVINSVYNRVCLRLKLCLLFTETSVFKDIGTIIKRITTIWKTHKDTHSVGVTASKSSHRQESYLRVLNIFLLAKSIAYCKNKRKILLRNLLLF